MNKKSTYLLGILLTIIVGSILYWMFCCNCQCNKRGNDKHPQGKEKTEHLAKVKTASLLPFIVKDADGNLSLNVNDNFNFKTSDANFMKPISESLQAELGKLKDYLAKNNGKTLSIKGFYTADETNNSIYPNLGLARANSVKNYLSSLGISSNLMDTFGELKENLVANSEGYFKGATEFGVANAVDNSDALKTLAEEIKANPLVLYFNTGQSSINLSSEQRQKIANISRYLDKVDGAKCLVTGHTDNTGDPQYHIPLGQKRADFAKNYFVRNGISENKIVANSKGDSQPIADNETEEGRAKNRRTVITIQ